MALDHSSPKLTAPGRMASSQNEFTGARDRGETLADVVEHLKADQRLDPRRRDAFLGAIRTMCKVLGSAANALPASMTEIARRLDAIPIDCRGRSRKTIANTRSRVKAALIHVARLPKMPPRGTPLTPEWAALYDQIVDLRLRNGLSKFVRLASFRGVPPSAVNDAFLHAVLKQIDAVNWGRATRPFWRQTATLWNEASSTIPGWPQTRLTPPPPSDRIQHLPLEGLPDSFRDDLDAYLKWASGPDPLAVDAPTTPLRASSIRQRREYLRLAGSTLATCRGDSSFVKSLSTLVEPENMRAILTAYVNKTQDKRPTAFIRGLAVALLAVARHWIKVPIDQLDELKRIKRRLGSTPTGLTEKNRALVRKFDDPALLRSLIDLPERLRKQVQTARLSPARRLQRMQIALAIQLLLVAPIRMQNLAMLELYRTLQWPTGRNGDALIVLLRHETKNEQPLEYPIEGKAKELLDEYLDRYRPRVGDREWLFVRHDGKQVSDSALRDGICKSLKRELGISMTPHQFRHLAAAVALDAHPGALGLVRDLLGHKNLKTTGNFYAGMRTREAVREYDRILDRRRTPIQRDV